MSLPSRESILTVSEDKKQLIKHICESLSHDQHFHEINKYWGRLFVTGQEMPPVETSNGIVSIRKDMSISHEEGDTMIIQQTLIAAQSNEGVSIIADDTYVFVLLLHFYFELKCKVPMFMVSTNENEVIDVGLTVSEHEDIIPSLLGAHAMTGCDTVACCNT